MKQKQSNKLKAAKREQKWKRIRIRFHILLFIFAIKRIARCNSSPNKYAIDHSNIKIEETKPKCTSDQDLVLFNLRLLNKHRKDLAYSFKLKDFGLEGGGPLAEFLAVEGSTDKAYARYGLGDTCYTHSNLETTNNNILLSLILGRAGDNGECKIIGILTNRGLEKCSSADPSTTIDIWEVINFSGGKSDHSSFSSIDASGFGIRVAKAYKPSLTVINDLGPVENLSEELVEMVVVEPLIDEERKEWPSLFNYKKKNYFNQLTKFNSFAEKINFEHFIPRLVRDDLPGFFLGKYEGSDPSDRGDLQLNAQRNPSSSQGLIIEFYLSRPESIESGEEYRVNLIFKGFAAKKEQIDFTFFELDYEVRITREGTRLKFKVFRDGEASEISQLTEFYEDTNGPAENYLYCSLTLGTGVLYYKDEENVRAKAYETLTLFRPGRSTKRKHHTRQLDLQVETIRGSTKRDDQITNVYIKASLTTNPPERINKAGIRVTALTQTLGIYPAFLVSSRNTQTQFPNCFFNLYRYKGCLSIAIVSGPGDHEVKFTLGKSHSLAESYNKKETNCKIFPFKSSCVIPEKGYISNLEYGLTSRVTSNKNPIKLKFYEEMTVEIKSTVVEFLSNLGTKYLVSCPHSCKYAIFGAKLNFD